MVEDVLVLDCEPFTSIDFESLNPCCGGRCSSTPHVKPMFQKVLVLILVVVEDVLVQ